MQIFLKGRDRNGNKAVREFVKRRVTSKLSRIAKRIRSVQIWIRDINGPRGSKDHVVQLLFRLKPTGHVAVQHMDYHPYAGIQAAIKSALSAVKQAFTRRRSNRIESFRRIRPDPGIRSQRVAGLRRMIQSTRARPTHRGGKSVSASTSAGRAV